MRESLGRSGGGGGGGGTGMLQTVGRAFRAGLGGAQDPVSVSSSKSSTTTPTRFTYGSTSAENLSLSSSSTSSFNIFTLATSSFLFSPFSTPSYCDYFEWVSEDDFRQEDAPVSRKRTPPPKRKRRGVCISSSAEEVPSNLKGNEKSILRKSRSQLEASSLLKRVTEKEAPISRKRTPPKRKRKGLRISSSTEEVPLNLNGNDKSMFSRKRRSQLEVSSPLRRVTTRRRLILKSLLDKKRAKSKQGTLLKQRWMSSPPPDEPDEGVTAVTAHEPSSLREQSLKRILKNVFGSLDTEGSEPATVPSEIGQEVGPKVGATNKILEIKDLNAEVQAHEVIEVMSGNEEMPQVTGRTNAQVFKSPEVP